mmetsp:Transcript_164/g.345  ORF Transcript_164/g.345 Transcript_164/m.345 type:complete len:118 (+) Transcript_164:117-470(+)|eukprot:CAMPEP_0172588398 /NCGR_PEP_ID=MMETSP1068-20121228/7290_1 /TAXON_ID=35684 /ORGANISM="Pseudopedinella elastica, Strain CCMP716" /LENGTH=117 /DNA_ID=CAMNT_0013383703 /DNA_START=65 /DNA_END=418 /DNA_ORIENTATION=-
MASRKRSFMEAGLPPMMYGYGDVRVPDSRSVKLVESMVEEHLQDVLKSAVEKARWQGRSSVDDMHVLLTTKNDPKRFAKLDHLIKMNETIKDTKDAHKKVLEVKKAKPSRGGNGPKD